MASNPFPNLIPFRHPLPSGFQLSPDVRSTTLPETPLIPPMVASGDVITSIHENTVTAALADLWTNEQWLASQALTDPTTAKGDLLARNATALARLAVGSNGQVLTADNAAPAGVKWAAAVAGVSTVFGRSGAVVAVAGDYTAALVTNAVSSIVTYADPAWISALAWAKITGAPALIPTSRQVIAGSGLAGGGALTADVTLTAPLLGPSGASHRAGIVPDPGAAGGAARYLREDATWAIPAGAGGGLTDPTTTLGDLIVRGGAAPPRLGVGTDGQALLADSAAPLGVKWGAVAAGGGSQTPWTSDINAAHFNLNRVKGIGIGNLQDAAANFGVFIAHDSIFDAFKQINSSSTGWAGFSLQNDLGNLFAFRVYGSGRTPSNVAALESSIPMTFFTGAVERMRITTAGLVGIGKTPATYKLEVAGDCDITGVYRRNGAPLAQTPWTSDIDGGGFALSNTSRIQVKSGTDNLDALLVSGASASQFLILKSSATTGRIEHWNGSGFGNVTICPDGGSVGMALSGGNVGIGTAAPQARLTINGSLASDTAGSAHQLQFAWSEVPIFGWRMAGGNSTLVLDCQTGTWQPSIAVNRTNTFVGIGTTSPAAPLHIHKGADSADAVVISGASLSQFMVFQSSASAGRIFHWNGSGFGNIVLCPNGGNVSLPSLPSTNPGAGTKCLYYDPADGNRVKFAA